MYPLFAVPASDIIIRLSCKSTESSIFCDVITGNCHLANGKNFKFKWTLKPVTPACLKSETVEGDTLFSETKYAFKNLTPDATYEVSIKTENEFGFGPDKKTEQITTLPAKCELLQPTITTSYFRNFYCSLF